MKLKNWLKWHLGFSCWYLCPVCGFRIRGKVKEIRYICGECVDRSGGRVVGVGVMKWEDYE